MNIYDEISRVAFEIWVKKGMPEGNDLENWLEAEQIVYASLREKSETDNTADKVVETTEVEVTTVTPIPVSDESKETVSQVSDEEKPKKRAGRTKKTTTTTASKTKTKKTSTTKKKA